MCALNWTEFSKAVNANKRGGRRSRRFGIKDGESISVRFLVNPNEPYIYKRHYAKSVDRYLVCAEDAVAAGQHQGCVVCYEANRLRRTQGKQALVRGAARVYAFSVYDPRKYHIIDTNPEKDKFQPCSDDARCKWCKAGHEAKTNGVSHWSVAESVANQLRQFEVDLLNNKCASCGLGKIKVVEYTCPNCSDVVEPDDPSQPTRCFSCDRNRVVMVQPNEVLQCSRCKDPKRMGLEHTWVVITRAGSGTTTSYNFSPGEFGPVPDGVDLTPVDFSAEPDFKPSSAIEQAAILGIPNPFTAQVQRSTDTEEDASLPMRDDTPFRR